MITRSTSRILRQKGFGLLEVLIAMALGLVLLGAVGYLFLGSKKMNTTQAEAVRMQESARNSMNLMGRALRQAGYALDVARPINVPALGGTDGGAAAGSALPPSDTLIVAHDPTWVPDATNPILGREFDCEGVSRTSNNQPNATTGIAPVNSTLINYRFFISGNALRCSNTPAILTNLGVVVAANVENLQVTYGIRSGEETIGSYSATPPADFSTVGAVRVSLMLRGNTPKQVAGGSQTLTFEGTAYPFNDGFLRQVYSSTFTLRNQTR